jgi:hypothetical protein
MKLRWAALALVVSVAAARAGDVRVTLRDGSVLVAEIEQVRGDVYTLQSPALGTVQIRSSDIQRIEMSAESAPRRAAAAPAQAPRDAIPSAAAPPTAEQLGAMQRRIVSDEAMMATVMRLQDDPQVQAILADPQIMEAVRAGDLGALSANPKLRALLDNPAVQDLNQRLGR